MKEIGLIGLFFGTFFVWLGFHSTYKKWGGIQIIFYFWGVLLIIIGLIDYMVSNT